MKNIFLCIVILSLISHSIAQDENNLVLNPSFESMDGKLKKLKQINIAKEWDSPTALKADLYSTEKESPVSAPVNLHGKEFPMDGENYAGIVHYSYNNKEPRTYLQTELVSPLSGGLEYCVKFHVSLSDLSKYAANNLSAYFGKEPLFLEGKGDIIFQKDKEFERVVLNFENKIYNARYNWSTVCSIYKASGKEAYLTIGNFYNNKDTKFEKLKKLDGFTGTQQALAYYYVDQVEVFLIEDLSDCDCSKQMNNANNEAVIYHKDYVREDGKYTVNELINMGTVYFDVKKNDIDNIFINDLARMVNILNANPNINIELHGHTDKMEYAAIKKDPENETLINLGKIRAENVKEYLLNKGVDVNRISIMSHDATQPDSDGYTELDYAKNRRVEFKIIE